MKTLHVVFAIAEAFSLFVGYLPPPIPPKAVVTSIADAGPGTLREAIENGERCIVFDVSGTIRLKSTLTITSPVDILGQTSPGGITISGATVEIAADNTYLAHLRIRTGAPTLEVSPNVKSRDGVRVRDCSDVCISNCSIGWASDENLDIWQNVKRFSCYDTIISEGLMFPRPDYPTGHSCGARVGPNSEAHFVRVVFAHCNSRCPLIAHTSRATMQNVVIYNAGSQAVGVGGAADSGPIHLSATGCVMITTKQTKKNLPMWEVKATDARVLARDCWRDGVRSDYWTKDHPDVAVLRGFSGNPSGRDRGTETQLIGELSTKCDVGQAGGLSTNRSGRDSASTGTQSRNLKK
jgi:hypothetical protein